MANGFTRRLVVALLGGTSIAALFAKRGHATPEAALRLVVLSDLHSAYGRLGQLLAAVEAELAESAAPAVILINGDVFESGNVVAARSDGVIDWAFLAGLRRLAPVVLNIGNHEPDLENDLAVFVRRAQGIGITVISNITDARTGALYAPVGYQLNMGAVTLAMIGVATDALNTYPKATRPALAIPEPVSWVAENLAAHAGAGTLPVILSHAGVVADRAMLVGLPDGVLLIGGHDHLLFTHEAGRTRYFHTGSWASVFTVVDVADDLSLSVAQHTVDPAAPASPEIASLIAGTLAAHLSDAERAIVGHTGAALTLAETGRKVAAIMAETVDADAGFIGHTTFGNGLPAGDVSAYQYAAVVRFDGKFMTADVDANTFAAIMTRANQDGDFPLERRTGDFLYSAPVAADKQTVRIVTNDWSATNQQKYFGRDDIAFTEVPDLRLKAVVAGALR